MGGGGKTLDPLTIINSMPARVTRRFATSRKLTGRFFLLSKVQIQIQIEPMNLSILSKRIKSSSYPENACFL